MREDRDYAMQSTSIPDSLRLGSLVREMGRVLHLWKLNEMALESDWLEAGTKPMPRKRSFPATFPTLRHGT